MSVIRFTVEPQGPHVHVVVRSGTEDQARAGQMPLAGTLVLTGEDWDGLRRLLNAGTLIPRSEGTPRIDLQERVRG
jgi:hypothetical protein